MRKTLNFPKNFLWGTATSAYQVEGGIKNNDWLQFADAGRACGHYHSYEEDFDLAKSLNQNAHRFSIEWSRIEPEEGKFDQKEIEHYQQVVSALRQRQIEPFVTLWHFTLPQWFVKKGHWLNKFALQYFVRYIERIVEALSPQVRFWVTINEPMVYASNSFLKAKWPPQKRAPLKAWLVFKQIIKAHELSYQIIHQINKQAEVGIAKNMSFFRNPLAFPLKYFWNDYFLQKIKKHQDFIGLNYYTCWNREICPEGIYYTLKDFKKYKAPIYITENGLADEKDKKRAKFILDHLAYVWQAIQEGIDVRGYFHWSLMDNFEWAEGFSPRFGLIEIDYQTLERKIRPSAKVYAEIANRNQVSTSLLKPGFNRL